MLWEQEQRRAAEREDREAQLRVIAGMRDRELVADGDADQPSGALIGQDFGVRAKTSGGALIVLGLP